jgi:hypothetical protein
MTTSVERNDKLLRAVGLAVLTLVIVSALLVAVELFWHGL